MGIVHGALRRDLLRTHDALTSKPYPQGRQLNPGRAVDDLGEYGPSELSQFMILRAAASS